MSTLTVQSKAPSPDEKATRELRLSIRTNAEQKELLRRAANARNTDISKFVLETSLSEAKRLVAEESIVVLSPQDYLELCRVMDETPAHNPELRALLHKKRVWNE